ncbi:hypothetical protein CLV24_1148 [Pontibacter ummariensis]|uniref:Uncharacterized protein n=1 Tax=Pontibacter ummariensis TaxID=1610492 RepID=A0A239HJJ0_9BACT|nr:hypothetical protein [Pontibacter ummariensis]PRY10280.1 hypothetical protein CLV24_1148 [Pontibacter ummariensis]SNS81291.1 hypothetical protein SAMN06296052_1148 [Pontibacter ummariensis]
MPVIGEDPVYNIGGHSEGCNNGAGFISLFGISTADNTELDVRLQTFSGTVLDRFTCPPGTRDAGKSYTDLANDNYTVVYTPKVDGLAHVGDQVNIAISCEAVPPPPEEEQPVCVATKAFTIEPRRGPRFFMVWKDDKHQQHRVEWMQKGYTGEPEELRGEGKPFTVEYPGLRNKLDVLSGSGAKVGIIVQRYGLMQDLYTVDEREYQVNHYIDGVLNWRGYHMADVYNEPWISIPFVATIQAYDGIGLLQNRPYLDPHGERYYGRARSIDVIFRCLRLLDLDLPVWMAVNVWETTMDLNVEPLSQAYVDQSGYYNDENEALTCKEVLERILKPYNAFIKQAKGALHIIRFTETQDVYQRRQSSMGKGDAQVQLDLKKEPEFEDLYEIRRFGEVSYREGSQYMTSMPAYKLVTSVTNYGQYENFVFNGDFERWVDGEPMFWNLEEGLQVEQILDGEKFRLGFPQPRMAGDIDVKYLRSEAYEFLVQSTRGFTVSFDYTITVEDYPPNETFNWLELPVFSLENGNLYLANDAAYPAVGNFNGTVVTFQNALIKSGVANVSNLEKRIDMVYANQNGSFTYQQGTTVSAAAPDTVPNEPAGTLIATYLTFDQGEVTFGSVSSATKVMFDVKPGIGEYYGEQQSKLRATRRYRGYYPYDIDPENRINIAGWDTLDRRFGVSIGDLEGDNGFFTKKGTFTVHFDPLSVAGKPRLFIGNPQVYRDNLRGVQITIDNVRFQERQLDGIERMKITGENEGQINTAPLELDLYHGSGIPRTEALITLADGTPAYKFNTGYLLQELTVRDILAQHPRALLVMSARLAGPVSPISVLKDPFLPNSRFLVDRYSYNAKSGLTEIEAIEIFGGPEELVPEDAIFTEDYNGIATEDFTYITIE